MINIDRAIQIMDREELDGIIASSADYRVNCYVLYDRVSIITEEFEEPLS